MKHTYSIGLDFGTLAGRAVLVDNVTGEEVMVSVYGYQDAIIDTYLPNSNIKLPKDYALQNPRDYMDACVGLLKDISTQSKVDPSDIVGIGIDATASTVLALDGDFLPLCFDERFEHNPHAWPKLWKHHNSQKQADLINSIAQVRNENFLKNSGGKVCAEWYWPKVLETIEEAPEILENAKYFVELGDWIVYLLTGQKVRSSAIASVHAQWSEEAGYPSDEYMELVNPLLRNAKKKNEEIPVQSIFTKAGTLTEDICQKTGLCKETAVGIACTDSPIALLSLGITGEGTGALILGTSSVFLINSRKYHFVEGAMAAVKNQMMPGYYGNMFGQSAVGDIFEWFVKNLVPHSFYVEAEKNGSTVFDVLNHHMDKLAPDQRHIVGLDWLNGNRSLLQNANLSGLLVGMDLSTTAVDIYRALVESTAFGLKKIVDAAKDADIRIEKIIASGGLPRKSPEIMQIYADILEIPIETTNSKQAIGCGAAILGALAAGTANGGYDKVEDAVNAMQCKKAQTYYPNKDNLIYQSMYRIYCELSDRFGRVNPNMMNSLKKSGQ